MRSALLLGAAAMLCAIGHAAAADPSYPNRPITFVVPYPPGGTTDAIARKCADELAKKLKNPVIVENVAGAGGSIAARKVLSSASDGYTLLVGSVNEIVMAPLTQKKPPYKASDFRPVIINFAAPLVLLVNQQKPLRSMQDFAAAARKGPPPSYGSPGQGSLYHVAMHILGQRLGANLLHVPYKGGAPFINDLIGGQIDAIVLPVATAAAQVKGGRMRPLGITSPARSAAMPDVPTMAESLPELKGLDVTVWAGIFAPAGTPPAVIDKLNAALREVNQSEAMQAFARDGGSSVPPSALDLYGAQRFVDAEDRRYRALLSTMKLED
jgi:tripartite-type tricarboxylate transporter receptor subunit TctC